MHVTNVKFDKCFCLFQVAKLDALGLQPVLFYAKHGRRWVAETVTSLSVTTEMKNILDKMQKAYEFFLNCKKNVK